MSLEWRFIFCSDISEKYDGLLDWLECVAFDHFIIIKLFDICKDFIQINTKW
jgi:hypothetical protein